MENKENEKLVDQYIAEDKVSAAVKLLFDMIVDAAEKKDFITAEKFRDKLMEVDSMALNEIVKTGEIIEEKKANAIDKTHMQTWSALYERFTVEESNAFYFATEALDLSPGDSVLEQGKPNACLYMVDEGTLKMSCNADGKEVPVKQVEKGQFVGDDTFISIQAFCSVSVKAETKVKIRRLSKTSLRQWSKKFPAMYNKIEGYINTSGSTHDLINSMNLKRRTQNRIPIKGTGKFRLFDVDQKKMGNPFKGSLVDVSSGGMCFVIRMSKRETARLLVGRKVQAAFTMKHEGREIKVDRIGIVISVRVYDLTDYSIHMRFDEKIEALDVG